MVGIRKTRSLITRKGEELIVGTRRIQHGILGGQRVYFYGKDHLGGASRRNFRYGNGQSAGIRASVEKNGSVYKRRFGRQKVVYRDVESGNLARIGYFDGIGDFVAHRSKCFVRRFEHSQIRALAVYLQAERIGHVKVAVACKPDNRACLCGRKRCGNVHRCGVPSLSAGNGVCACGGVGVSCAEGARRVEQTVLVVDLRRKKVACGIVGARQRAERCHGLTEKHSVSREHRVSLLRGNEDLARYRKDAGSKKIRDGDGGAAGRGRNHIAAAPQRQISQVESLIFVNYRKRPARMVCLRGARVYGFD